MLANLIGFIIGALGSFLVWLYLFRFVVPKIQFSERISKIVRSGEALYRIKFNNHSRRNVIDLSVVVHVNILGLFEDHPNNWKNVNVKLNVPSVPILKTSLKGGMVANMYINRTKEFSSYPFPKEVIEKYRLRKLTLEDLFEIGEKVNVRIHIMGYDEFSGARKMFLSKVYRKSDISILTFEPFSLDLKKENSKNVKKLAQIGFE